LLFELIFQADTLANKLMRLVKNKGMNVSEDKNQTAPIWREQEGETTKAYAAFCAYRDYGIDRSIQKSSQ
jgi:hypothetical protein